MLLKAKTKQLELTTKNQQINLNFHQYSSTHLFPQKKLISHKENNLLNLKIDKAISKTLQDGKNARRKDAIHFYDNFSSKSLRTS